MLPRSTPWSRSTRRAPAASAASPHAHAYRTGPPPRASASASAGHHRTPGPSGAHVHGRVAEVVGREHGRVGHLHVHLDPLVGGVPRPAPRLEDRRHGRHRRLVRDEHLTTGHLEPAVERATGPDADRVTGAGPAGPRGPRPAVAVGHDVDVDPPAQGVVVADRVPAQPRSVLGADRGDGGPHVDGIRVGHDERPPRQGHHQPDVLVGPARHEVAQPRRLAGHPPHPATEVDDVDDGRGELRRVLAHERRGSPLRAGQAPRGNGQDLLGDAHDCLLRGMTTGVPDSGSMSTLAVTPKTSAITSGVTTSAGEPSATMRPSRIATRWSA